MVIFYIFISHDHDLLFLYHLNLVYNSYVMILIYTHDSQMKMVQVELFFYSISCSINLYLIDYESMQNLELYDLSSVRMYTHLYLFSIQIDSVAVSLLTSHVFLTYELHLQEDQHHDVY
jgi:hypothetical protein